MNRPTRQFYSPDSILWITHLTKEEDIFIEHAENHAERKVQVTKADGLSYLKNVDGYRQYTDPKRIKR